MLAWWLGNDLRGVPAGIKHQQLTKLVERYPRLHQACQDLATVEHTNDLALLLSKYSMKLGFGVLAAGVYVGGKKNALSLIAKEGLTHIQRGRSHSVLCDQ